MFGFKRQQPKTAKPKKVSSEAIPKVKSSTKKIKAKPKKTVRKKSISVGEQSFSNPTELRAYYKAEGERVKKAMKDFKIKQMEGYLTVSKNNLMGVLSQKKRLGMIATDIEDHRKQLGNKLSEMGVEKDKVQGDKVVLDRFVSKMKSLEREAKKVQDMREQLMEKEAELVIEMKKLATQAKRDATLTDAATADELEKYELSKEAILLRAKDILGEQHDVLFADNEILDKLDHRVLSKIDKINTQIAEIKGATKKTLEKRELLEISEKDTDLALKDAQRKLDKLESKYHKLLSH
ncbi:MAG: hypothetical protein ACI9P9_000735 [Patescibacteria group bacterium]|jgi:hypothetical protein